MFFFPFFYFYFCIQSNQHPDLFFFWSLFIILNIIQYLSSKLFSFFLQSYGVCALWIEQKKIIKTFTIIITIAADVDAGIIYTNLAIYIINQTQSYTIFFYFACYFSMIFFVVVVVVSFYFASVFILYYMMMMIYFVVSFFSLFGYRLYI